MFVFEVEKDLLTGISKLESILDFNCDKNITVSAVCGDKTGVCLKDGKATVYYASKTQFFRQLSILVNKAKTESDFEIYEDVFFETMSVMIDTSRCGVPSVEGVKRITDYLAVMGYNMMMLYTEDTVKLENYKYFGYMRGRYTEQELRSIDDYANVYGIEVIPCIECYGHMEKYLIWPESAPIKDTASVLLAREPKTFEFLDELIRTVSSCFRSKRIHIGMDEAWDMGRGAFLNKHGYVPPFEIFNEFMEELVTITDKYGLTPMMWSDMYFRVSSGGKAYYSEQTEVPESVCKKIPEQVELVFWHYGEAPYCDDFMLKKHNALGRKVIYAGGLWDWIGHFPENNYAMDAISFSLNACRNNGVKEAMLTIWGNDNNECDLFANLLGLSYFAEKCFDNGANEQKIRERFEATTGGSYEAFMNMSNYHNVFDGRKYERFHDRFLGKALFWQDVMEGLYDSQLFKNEMSGHYAAFAAYFKNCKKDRWSHLYDFAEKVFDYLAIKTLIAEKLVPSYKNGDKETLAEIANTLMPILQQKTKILHAAHKKLWFETYKPLGWANLDIRYAGVVSRCDTAISRLNDYLDGRLETLEELDEPRLDKAVRGFTSYSQISTPNIRT